MKNALKIIGLLVGLSATPLLAQPSYPMVCRGGSGTLGYQGDTKSAVFYFQKSAGPAGQGLAPGFCSWRDRAIGQNEPPCLRQVNVNATAWLFPGQMQNAYFTSTQAPWLREMLKSSTFQTFQVYNPGNNCFVVTRLGN